MSEIFYTFAPWTLKILFLKMTEYKIKILGAQYAANPDYHFGDSETPVVLGSGPEMKKSQEAVRSPGFVLEGDGSAAHATRGRDRRQEGGERSYYNLHCNLNKTLLHTLPPFS